MSLPQTIYNRTWHYNNVFNIRVHKNEHGVINLSFNDAIIGSGSQMNVFDQDKEKIKELIEILQDVYNDS